MAIVVRNVEIDLDGKGARQFDVRLTLDLTANAVGAGGTIRAEALLTTDRPTHPVRRKRIEFECGTEKRVEETDDRGIASTTFIVAFGTHSVRATLEGTGLSVREQHTFPRPPLKVPKALSVVVSGEPGKQMLTMRVTAEDGSAVGGHTVIVRQGGSSFTESTGVDGIAKKQLELIGSAYVEVQAGNEEYLVWRRILPGT